MASAAACGFTSTAAECLDSSLDSEPLVRNRAGTFAMCIAGESMTGAELFPGDGAVVYR